MVMQPQTIEKKVEAKSDQAGITKLINDVASERE
jgi:hypothetical protein